MHIQSGMFQCHLLFFLSCLLSGPVWSKWGQGLRRPWKEKMLFRCSASCGEVKDIYSIDH
jgi:hypothetical protein